ncbi:MAG: hypothetical protein IT375_14650 [Polyangiaceae bacterium]|nr:hypothetical protein [Polyangiaceae bacterium]
MTTTLDLSVDNTGFLLDRLGQDCAPLQYIRELTQNAIEAVRRTGRVDGLIVWDRDPAYLENGIEKLTITDNGDGMTGPEMVQHINCLSSSGSAQSLAGNYGVGAKIAAATRNHAGLIYLSWKRGEGNMIHLWRDPATGKYGLKRFASDDGTYPAFISLADDTKPEVIGESGTRVVLLGDSEEANTWRAPAGHRTRDRWILKYLNMRYFSIPEGITIRARDVGEGAAKVPGFRTVTGQGPFLQSKAVASGRVPLEGAVAHWWILPERDQLVTEGPSYLTTGHVAALYQQELYEIEEAHGGRIRLQSFGIVFGWARVVLYIEPTPELGAITTNTARTRLIVDGEDLPWAAWAEEFRASIPDEIRALMEELGSKAEGSDHRKTIRERLKPLMDLYRVSRYRPRRDGELRASDDLTVGGAPDRDPKPRTGHSQSGTKGGRAGGAYANHTKREGQPAERVRPDNWPTVRWVSVGDGTREQGDLEDRAGRYLKESNELHINSDFRVFNDMVERTVQLYGDAPGVKPLALGAVRQWFEQVLVEAVLGIQALENDLHWDPNAMTAALSEEALTFAIMPRYFVFAAIKRDVGGKFGKV